MSMMTEIAPTAKRIVWVTSVKTPFLPMRSAGISSVLTASIPSRTERAMTFPAKSVQKAAAPVKIWEAVLAMFFINNLAV